uniref:SKP1 component dimerisation domain-containing protein n=1 Tax=Oryza punctata TaxID=4537 RepID=A0A0E0JXJ2_ORYPU
MLEEGAGGEDDVVGVVINLPDVVKGGALARVVEYCDHHGGGADPGSALSSFPPAADNGFGRYGRTAFDREFLAGIPVDQAAFFDAMLAADYLAVEGLIDLMCSAVARQLNKPPERLRELFHVVNDFAADEEEEIRREMYVLGPLMTTTTRTRSRDAAFHG